jgi:hypothetical protein
MNDRPVQNNAGEDGDQARVRLLQDESEHAGWWVLDGGGRCESLHSINKCLNVGGVVGPAFKPTGHVLRR